MWVEYEILAPRPRQVAAGTVGMTPDPGLRAVIERALTRFGLTHLRGRKTVTDLVIDAEPAGPPGLARYRVSVSYWPEKERGEEQP